MTTDVIDDLTTETTEHLTADIDLSYLDAPDAPPPDAKPRPTPGKYHLRVGVVEGSFDPGRSGTNERGEWTIPASVKIKPMFTIVSDEDGDETFSGVPLAKGFALDTVPLKGRNFSTLSSFFALMGVEMPRPENDSKEAKEACIQKIILEAKALEGQVTPVAVAVTINGSIAKDGPSSGNVRAYRGSFKREDGTTVYLDEKLFRTGDQSLSLADYQASRAEARLLGQPVPGWASRGFIVDFDKPRFTLAKPNENVEQVVVWANLEPTRYAFKVGR